MSIPETASSPPHNGETTSAPAPQSSPASTPRVHNGRLPNPDRGIHARVTLLPGRLGFAPTGCQFLNEFLGEEVFVRRNFRTDPGSFAPVGLDGILHL